MSSTTTVVEAQKGIREDADPAVVGDLVLSPTPPHFHQPPKKFRRPIPPPLVLDKGHSEVRPQRRGSSPSSERAATNSHREETPRREQPRPQTHQPTAAARAPSPRSAGPDSRERLHQELLMCKLQLRQTIDAFEEQKGAMLGEINALKDQIETRREEQQRQRMLEQRLAGLDKEWKLREDAIWARLWEVREADLADSARQMERHGRSIRAECLAYLQEAATANAEARKLSSRPPPPGPELRQAPAQCGGQLMSDREVVAAVKQLRGAIRSFVLTYLEAPQERLNSPDSVQPGRPSASLQPNGSVLGTAMLTGQLQETQSFLFTDKYYVFMQALIWRYLEQKIFGNFVWAGDAANALRELFSSLSPDHSSEAKHQVQQWKLVTAQVLVDAANKAALRMQYQARKDAVISEISSLTEATRRRTEPWNEYVAAIGQLVDTAAGLDEQLHLRPPTLGWFDCDPKTEPTFDGKLMTHPFGHAPAAAGARVVLMVFPGLGPRDFATDDVLLPIEVLCDTGHQISGRRATAPVKGIEDAEHEPAVTLPTRRRMTVSDLVRRVCALPTH